MTLALLFGSNNGNNVSPFSYSTLFFSTELSTLLIAATIEQQISTSRNLVR